MVYLPAEKIMIQADLYTPGPPDAKPIPAPNNGNIVALIKNVEEQKLAVDRLLPLHGRIVPFATMLQAGGR